MLKGSFVVLEGTDSSGKKTQLDLLTARLIKRGLKVEALDFPRYQDNVFGELVGRFLNGEFGELGQVSPYLAVLPYMIDQYLAHRCIDRWLTGGKLVVANRYFTSNVHQIAKFPKGEDREKFRRWLWPAGWNELGISKPDLVIVLLMPPPVARQLVDKRERRDYLQEKLLDITEADQSHQVAAYEEYIYTAKQEPSWETIACVDQRGNLKAPAAIHQEIFAMLLQKHLI